MVHLDDTGQDFCENTFSAVRHKELLGDWCSSPGAVRNAVRRVLKVMRVAAEKGESQATRLKKVMVSDP